MYFSARSANWAPLLFQQITRCHSVFSCFSPPCPVHWRLVASDRLATREPLFVLRTSGSAPKFPISITLLRLRLTADLPTMAGRGPRATTVYESQVILSIKDTPLGLKFCRHPQGEDGGPQDHGVLDRPAVVTGPPGDLPEAQRLVQPSRHGVGLPHLEIHRLHAALPQRREHSSDQRTAHPLAEMRRRHPEVENLPFSAGAHADCVSPDHAPLLGDEELRPGRQSL